MSNYEREWAVAEAAVRQAAALCRSVRAEVSPDVLAKRDKSPVTVADFGSQALVARALRDAFPADPLVAEEDAAELRAEGQKPLLDSVVRHLQGHLGSDVDADSALSWIDLGGAEPGSRFWTLDPIDGTKGFLRNEQYAVALALLIEGRPQVAALACPNLVVEGFPSPGAVFLAERGQGARVLPLDGDAPARTIHVSSLSDPSQARFCESVESGHSDQGDSARIAAHLGPESRAGSPRQPGQVRGGRPGRRGDLPAPADPGRLPGKNLGPRRRFPGH